MLMGSPVLNSFPIITIICSQFSLITVLLATRQVKGAKTSSLLDSIRGREMLNDLPHPRVHSGEGTGTPLRYSCLEKSHGWRSLVGCSPWGLQESDTTERLHFHFSLSCIGEGNATHSSVLAWRTPGTAEPGGLPSMGSNRVGHVTQQQKQRKQSSLTST